MSPDRYGEEYEEVNEPDLSVDDVVIVERKRWDYNSGAPKRSLFFRARVGEHRTVAGPKKHLVNEPDLDFPNIAPWQQGWIYAGNDSMIQMWRAKNGQKAGDDQDHK